MAEETTGDVEITLHEALFIRSGDNCNHGIMCYEQTEKKCHCIGEEDGFFRQELSERKKNIRNDRIGRAETVER